MVLPHSPGTENNLQMFRLGLKYQLDYSERVAADDRHIGECLMYC